MGGRQTPSTPRAPCLRRQRRPASHPLYIPLPPTPRSHPCTPHTPLPAAPLPACPAAWRASCCHGCCSAAAALRVKTSSHTVSRRVRRWLHLPPWWQRSVRLCCYRLHATLAVGCLPLLSQGASAPARPRVRGDCLRTQPDTPIERTGMGFAFVWK